MNSVEELLLYISPFGYLDLEKACAIGDSVWLFEGDIAEIIHECIYSWGTTSFDRIDPVYCVLEHILENARAVIEDNTGYDFINDYTGPSSEIYTYWNYMCSSYDYSQGALEALFGVLKRLETDELRTIQKDKYCAYFLKELGIELEDWRH